MMVSRSFRNYEIRGWVPKSLQRMVQVVVETVKQVPSSSPDIIGHPQEVAGGKVKEG